jgi:hypothetical protein
MLDKAFETLSQHAEWLVNQRHWFRYTGLALLEDAYAQKWPEQPVITEENGLTPVEDLPPTTAQKGAAVAIERTEQTDHLSGAYEKLAAVRAEIDTDKKAGMATPHMGMDVSIERPQPELAGTLTEIDLAKKASMDIAIDLNGPYKELVG